MITVRKASMDDAEAVYRMLSAISWIASSLKTESGLNEIRDCCKRGEIWVVDADGEVVSTMLLRLDFMADSLGYKQLSIPILTTLKEHRQKGYARLMVRRAKVEATQVNGTLEGYPENDKSLALLKSEGFELIEGERDKQNNDLYRWPPGR